MTALEISKSLRNLADTEIAKHSLRFFKTAKGEYGEGDMFLGIRVPLLRRIAKTHCNISLDEILKLLKSKFHEERMCALFLMIQNFEKGNKKQRKDIYNSYLSHTFYINNWDLVDASAHKIVGAYLEAKNRAILFKLSKSESLWERRIAVIATFWFIRLEQYEDTFELSRRLLTDEEDLIHKAVGWMLREIGKRDLSAEKKFLHAHYLTMPRTMLRYSIEKFPEDERKKYLSGNARIK